MIAYPIEAEAWELPANAHEKEAFNIDLWYKQPPAWLAYKHKRRKIAQILKNVEEGKNKDCLTPIFQAIEKAQYILTLQDDYDGEGSLGYSPKTFKRAESFLKAYAETFFEKFNLLLPLPKILPGPDSSIDILWKNDECELLINFPADPKVPAAFYGDRKEGLSIKGHLIPSINNPGLLEWLKKQ